MTRNIRHWPPLATHPTFRNNAVQGGSWEVIGFRRTWISGFAFDKGFVVLHHAIANYNEWDGYAELLGARYYLRPKTIGGVAKARSQYQHDVRIHVKVADPRHPVARGVQDFVIHDETYKGFDVAPNVKPLLNTEEPLSGPVIGWTKQNGKSRWVYLQLGHGAEAFNDSNYRRLLAQSIRWSARK